MTSFKLWLTNPRVDSWERGKGEASCAFGIRTVRGWVAACSLEVGASDGQMVIGDASLYLMLSTMRTPVMLA